MDYQTLIFEESKKKVVKEWLIVGGILIIIIAILLLKALYLSGIGVISIGYLGYWLFKVKNESYKEMGIKSYGKKRDQIIIYEDSIKIRDQLIPYSDLKKLTIYVDEYSGMPKQFFGSYHGGNNEIRFVYNGDLFSFNYWIKSKADFTYVEKLVLEIEKKYPPPKDH
ncbi:MAG: hypothetical protein ABJG47_19375 [Ekhidna sp.]